jgi:hypothetical protein
MAPDAGMLSTHLTSSVNSAFSSWICSTPVIRAVSTARTFS